MNPLTLHEAKKIASKARSIAPELRHTEVVIAPSFAFLAPCTPRKAVKHFHIAAQAVSYHESGSHTGEVSVDMLRSMGIEYVIVGHSERRKGGENNAMVAAEVNLVLARDMKVILCVGEDVRDPEAAYLEFLKNQIKESLAGVPKKYVENIVIAYEPVWAIGAKEAMKPEDIYEMSIFVKKIIADIFSVGTGVRVPVLYGGSVNGNNARDIMTVGKVDGLLVGRESVNPSGFRQLLLEVDGVKQEN